MALGGALGGAVTGKTFGPAAIALQVLGGFFDELAAKAATLGQALNLQLQILMQLLSLWAWLGALHKKQFKVWRN